MTLPSPDAPPVNHHADHPPFAGATGVFAALSMLTGRDDTARLAVELTALTAGDHLVDVGCGPGAGARLAARHGATVTAVDPAPVMLRVARLVTRRRAAIEWVVGRAEALPVPDGSATVVWALATVHHWRDVGAGLQAARRALAPGGRLLAVERRVSSGAQGLASHGWLEAQAEAFADECRAAGFTQVRVETRPAGHQRVFAVLAVAA